MLEPLLKSGLSMLEGKPGSAAPAGGSRSDTAWGKFGAGAATGGALGPLLGSKGARRIGRQGAELRQRGGAGGDGLQGLQPLAYNHWQAQQAQAAAPASGAGVPRSAALPPPRTVNLDLERQALAA